MLRPDVREIVEQSYQQAPVVYREWLHSSSVLSSIIVAPNGQSLEVCSIDARARNYCLDVRTEFGRLVDRNLPGDAIMLLHDQALQLTTEVPDVAFKSAKLAFLYRLTANAELEQAEQHEFRLGDGDLSELDLSKLYISAGVNALRASIAMGGSVRMSEHAGLRFLQAGMPNVYIRIVQLLPQGMELERPRMRIRSIHPDIEALDKHLWQMTLT